MIKEYPCGEEYLEQIPVWASKKHTIEDIRDFLTDMGDPDRTMTIVHVAGTNGKGSVCAYLESILLKAGYHTGTFISPHLIDIRERFRLDGQMVSQEAFQESFQRIFSLTAKEMKLGREHPSYFEFLFYMAMDLFHKTAPDVVILETGLGGTYDATNGVRNPAVSAITSIGLDHTQYLGETVEEIASQKAGIIRKRTPVVFDGRDGKAAAVIQAEAKRQEAPYWIFKDQSYKVLSWNSGGIQAVLKTIEGQDFPIEISTEAEYQIRNGGLALWAAEILNKQCPNISLTEEQIRQGLESMKWPARMEEVLPGVFLDGAHNPHGIREFAKAAKKICQIRGKRAVLLFSAVGDKDHGKMARLLLSSLPVDEAVLVRLKSERGLNLGDLSEDFNRPGLCCREFDSVPEAMDALLQGRDEEHLIFCAGSLYLMGELKAELRRLKNDRF